MLLFAAVTASEIPSPQLPDTASLTGILSTVLGGSLLVVGAFAWRGLRALLERILGQTENEHKGAEYPNLRDELTAARCATEETAKVVQGIATSVSDLQRIVLSDREAARAETEGVRQDLRGVATRLDRHVEESSQARR